MDAKSRLRTWKSILKPFPTTKSSSKHKILFFRTIFLSKSYNRISKLRTLHNLTYWFNTLKKVWNIPTENSEELSKNISSTIMDLSPSKIFLNSSNKLVTKMEKHKTKPLSFWFNFTRKTMNKINEIKNAKSYKLLNWKISYRLNNKKMKNHNKIRTKFLK